MALISKKFDQLEINEYGTENISIILYSLIRFTKPSRILEVGAGYTTLFLANALNDIKIQLSSQPSNHEWLSSDLDYYKTKYNPILDVVDDFSLEESFEYYQNILNKNNLHANVNFINKNFWEFYNITKIKYDFIWFDAGDIKDWYQVMNSIYPNLPPGGIIIFHNTISQIPGKLFEVEMKLFQRENKIKDLEIMSFIEPHKHYQNSFTICKKANN